MSTSAAKKREQDRRKSQRVSVLQMGTLVVGAGNSRLECIVLDITNSGAKLRAPDLAETEDVFDLRLATGTTHRCKVAWRDKQNLGVDFLT